MVKSAPYFLQTRQWGSARADKPVHVAVVGGGLGGLAAATVLAERGLRVSLYEANSCLGGRLATWPHRGELLMDRGFHAFFRQYYNLRAWLRRIDPGLHNLVELEDYPIMGPAGLQQSFSGLATLPPFNVIDMVRRTKTLGIGDLLKVNAGAALEMLAYDANRTYAQYDAMSARDYLDSIRFPGDARRMLFDVFSHSFFNPEEDMSAAEMLMMFHFYFMGNTEGLVFDVLDRPFSEGIFDPMQDYLQERGVEFHFEQPVHSIENSLTGSWRLSGERTLLVETDAVVLATTVDSLKSIVQSSPSLHHQKWHSRIESLSTTSPFVVWRMWLDVNTDPGRSPFVGTAGLGLLDNISLYHEFESQSRRWAERTGGSVVELHAYAVDRGLDASEIKRRLRASLFELYPETRSATVLDEAFMMRQDCPSFAPGSHRLRPSVNTPFDGLALAGDYLRLPIPSALMERAVSSGFMAANQLMAAYHIRAEPIASVAPRGLLAPYAQLFRHCPGHANDKRQLLSVK